MDEQTGAIRPEDLGSTFMVTPQSQQPQVEPGTSIGPFTILRRLGEGGFGVVFLAEQTHPVKRQVALKVIKPGMDTRAVIARFEAERQALALMDHPGIAQVHEVGATQEGRPWFAMEYVKGEPVTRYCDRHRLGTRQRLELFIAICEAVQHAHTKGIIHRDLKPGNILVSVPESGQPRIKIIDFGIAKALSQPLTEKTLFTAEGQIIGTLEYMSPEQAELTSLDVDTRSDVYSLGVILYELLTGKPPFDPKSLREAGILEIQRIIREEDPPRPSTRLSTIEKEEGSKIAEARQTKLAELTGTLRRELEWIPLKALRKDRTQRYESARDLGEDVHRYLAGEPLEAGPESARYRLKKFVRRNRGPVVAACLLLVVLLGGIVSTTIFAVRASDQAAQARTEAARSTAVKDFVTTMLSSVDPARAGAMDKALMKLVLAQAAESVGEQFDDQPLVEAEIRGVIGGTYESLGMYDEAEPHLVETIKIHSHVLGEEHPDTLNSTDMLGEVRLNQGHFDGAEVYFGEVVETRRRILGDAHPDTLTSINNMGVVLAKQGKLNEAEGYYREALEGLRHTLGDEDPKTLKAVTTLGILFKEQGNYDEADVYFREALGGFRRTLGEEHPHTLLVAANLGDLLRMQGKYEEAQPYLLKAMDGNRRILGNEHPDTLTAIGNMGILFVNQGNYDEAELLYREALDGKRRVLGSDHPETLTSIANMASLLGRQGKHDEAERYFHEAVDIARRTLGDKHPHTLISLSMMGGQLRRHGKYAESEPYFLEAIEGMRSELGEAHPLTLKSIMALALLYEKWGKPEEAQKYRDLIAAIEAKMAEPAVP